MRRRGRLVAVLAATLVGPIGLAPFESAVAQGRSGKSVPVPATDFLHVPSYAAPNPWDNGVVLMQQDNRTVWTDGRVATQFDILTIFSDGTSAIRRGDQTVFPNGRSCVTRGRITSCD